MSALGAVVAWWTLWAFMWQGHIIRSEPGKTRYPLVRGSNSHHNTIMTLLLLFDLQIRSNKHFLGVNGVTEDKNFGDHMTNFLHKMSVPVSFQIKNNETYPFSNHYAWLSDSYVALGILGFFFYVLLGITSLPSVSNAVNWREFRFVQVSAIHKPNYIL